MDVISMHVSLPSSVYVVNQLNKTKVNAILSVPNLKAELSLCTTLYTTCLHVVGVRRVAT